ncbi:M48 family metalloprotease [Marinobacter sp.]|uniref:M48 family metalloprotease n=1 Tax=Marinobacter sp. TaxID=50741 RepID=UPI0019C1BE4C|nr:M48 family metalloprotease [Marinobacter sp.]MBC7192154.1 M48 family metallopeptidase [Marinobacter sp.]
MLNNVVPSLLSLVTAALLILSTAGSAASSESTTLPSIGGIGGGLISDRRESDIGEQVMMSLRRSAPRITDPIVTDYLSSIVYQLVPSAPLSDRKLTVVAIDNSQINAFAVPGNIVGVNGGLFLNAKTEQQFASVIAHELAHLSQRHFSRRLEQQENAAPLTIAGMIAGIVLSAVTQSDLGIAAIAGTQALSIQNMLEYSRAHEREADRIGIDILAQSGLDPRGMPEMFEIMLESSRLQGSQPPEYLSTHPLTRNRVSDTRSRAEQYPSQAVPDALEYHLVRARLQVHYARSPGEAVEFFRNYLNSKGNEKNLAARYGLAVAYLEDGQADKAREQLQILLNDNPARITFLVSLAETWLAQKDYEKARSLLVHALKRNPGNYPITETLSRVETEAGNGRRAADYLKDLLRDYPDREHLWLRLAEAEGLARNIVGVHRARAEYALLMGDPESARRQLRQAQEKAPASSPLHQVISERLAEVTSRMAASQR